MMYDSWQYSEEVETAFDKLAGFIWRMNFEKASLFSYQIDTILDDPCGADDLRTALMMWSAVRLQEDLPQELRLVRVKNNRTYKFVISVDESGLFDFEMNVQAVYFDMDKNRRYDYDAEFVNCSLVELVERIIPEWLEDC